MCLASCRICPQFFLEKAWIWVTIYIFCRVVLTWWNGKVLRLKHEMCKLFKTNPVGLIYKIGVSWSIGGKFIILEDWLVLRVISTNSSIYFPWPPFGTVFILLTWTVRISIRLSLYLSLVLWALDMYSSSDSLIFEQAVFSSQDELPHCPCSPLWHCSSGQCFHSWSE